MSDIGLLLILVLSFIIFSISMLIIFKSKFRDERENLIKEILMSKPKSIAFNSLRHLGQEDFDGWIWNHRKVKELSYKELLDIYNIVFS